MKKALLVTRVSGFVPQFEMNNVKILQEFGYEVHYAADYNTIVYGNDNSRLDGTGIVRHQICIDERHLDLQRNQGIQEIRFGEERLGGKKIVTVVEAEGGSPWIVTDRSLISND